MLVKRSKGKISAFDACSLTRGQLNRAKFSFFCLLPIISNSDFQFSSRPVSFIIYLLFEDFKVIPRQRFREFLFRRYVGLFSTNQHNTLDLGILLIITD